MENRQSEQHMQQDELEHSKRHVKTDSHSPGHEIPRLPRKVNYGVHNSKLLTGKPILTR
jgi:hypothetical protein